MKDRVAAKGFLNIMVVDKKTGKIVSHRKLENDLHQAFAEDLTNTLVGTSGYAVGKIDKVSLYDTGNAFIKDLTPPTTLECLSYSDHYEAHAVFEDNSSDEYTVGLVDLIAVRDSVSRIVAFKSGLSVTKTADQKLIVDWTIAVYFTP